MFDGEEIGNIFKKVYRTIYGGSGINSVFNGGNVGTAILGMSIVEASKNVENGLIEFSKSMKYAGGEAIVINNNISGGLRRGKRKFNVL